MGEMAVGLRISTIIKFGFWSVTILHHTIPTVPSSSQRVVLQPVVAALYSPVQREAALPLHQQWKEVEERVRKPGLEQMVRQPGQGRTASPALQEASSALQGIEKQQQGEQEVVRT